MKSILSLLTIALLLVSCSGGGGKKVLVMASGKVQINGNTVTLDPGTTHNEVTLEPTGDSITVVAPAGNTSFAVAEPGYYLLNLKKDTIVGSYQRVGTDNSQVVVSEGDVFNSVDSLKQLMAGQNASEANRNYNIPPMQMEKITANTQAEIIGPFRRLPGSFEAGREHEIYKFSTNKEIRETVDRLQKMLSNDSSATK